ncbi:MAG: choice-of-anchor J domain-containing protein [Bacteroidota bacterium]
MKKILLFTMMAVALILFTNNANAQLTAGSYGENFTMQDYLGTTYSLYTYTDAGKPVIMDVSAVWCLPCWNYHQSGALETYYNTYGPPGDNSSMVLWIEGDQNPVACLQGTGCGTQGNWTTGTTFPMMLTVAPNNAQVCTDYQIGYFPTIYLICPNRKVTEAGQLNAAGLHTAALGCPAPGVNALDAAVWSTNVPAGMCETTTTPTFYLQNYGSTTLTSCNVVVKLDGSTVSTTPWTGSLAKYEIDDVVLPTVTGITDGTHILTFEITGPNGGTDENPANSTKDVSFSASLPIVSTPLTEGFVNSVFPPNNWLIANPDGGLTWERSTAAGGFGTSSTSAYIDFYSIDVGNIDDLGMPPVDLSTSVTSTFSFNMAHKMYSASYSDDLKVQVSTNCGTSWTTVWNKSGAALATVSGYTTNPYVPLATEWRSENIDLSAYIGQPKVFLRFRATSGYGNNLYIDDINLSSTVSIDEQDASLSNVTVYPNPASGNTAVVFTLSGDERVSISVKNLLGQNVISYDEKTYSAGTYTEYVSTDNLSQGVYYLNIIASGQKHVQKIVVVN